MPVISCSWLSKSKARSLIGDLAGHLKKPEIHYSDFVAALRAAGIALHPPAGIQEIFEQD
jgi:hypothetical protein